RRSSDLDLVHHRGIMTSPEFGKLVALAQMTPGPIGINTATYVGFTQQGVAGGVVATVGLLTPAMVLVILAMRFMARYEKTLWMRGALAGLRPGAFGLLLVALIVFMELSVFSGKLPVDYFRSLLSGTPAEWNFYLRPVPLALAAAVAWLQLKTRFSFLGLLAGAAVLGAFLC
ncbi:MAG: chromate transporter, partial [Victivallaceae bacterium]